MWLFWSKIFYGVFTIFQFCATLFSKTVRRRHRSETHFKKLKKKYNIVMPVLNWCLLTQTNLSVA